jgi:hypothetical protein
LQTALLDSMTSIDMRVAEEQSAMRLIRVPTAKPVNKHIPAPRTLTFRSGGEALASIRYIIQDGERLFIESVAEVAGLVSSVAYNARKELFQRTLRIAHIQGLKEVATYASTHHPLLTSGAITENLPRLFERLVIMHDVPALSVGMHYRNGEYVGSV